MVAIKKLTEDEKYLAYLLMDDSGVDFIEWALRNHTAPDGCTRLFPYQWPWMTDDSQFQLSACGRDLSKTFSIIGECLAHPYSSPGLDLLVTAPNGDHLAPITGALEERLLSIRFMRELLDGTTATQNGIKKVPSWEAKFKNGSKIVSRIPKEKGQGWKGQHAKKVLCDEAQEITDVQVTELYPTRRKDVPRNKLKFFGVTNATNNFFDRIAADPRTHYKVHRVIAQNRPSWSDAERAVAVSQYGAVTTLNYGRNIFGRAQGIANNLFVTNRLMACVRTSENPWAIRYNADVYKHVKIDADTCEMLERPPSAMFEIPPEHIDQAYLQFWGGWDIGLTNDPSEMLIFGALQHPTSANKKYDGRMLYRLLMRLSLTGIAAPAQVDVLVKLIDGYGRNRFQRMALDGTGLGLPIYQAIDELPIREYVRGYGFAEKLVVGWEDRQLKPNEKLKDIELKAKTPDAGLMQLRELVDARDLELPLDVDLLSQMQGVGEDHALHAMFEFGVAVQQVRVNALEETMQKREPVVARFGWA